MELAKDYGIELVSPTPSGPSDKEAIDQLNIDDFNIDEATEEVLCCPAGRGIERPSCMTHTFLAP